VRSLRLPDNRPPKFHLRLKTASRSGELVLRTKDLQVGYPDKLLFSAEDIVLRRQDCAALIGPNGAGKTTFLKTTLENLSPLRGEVMLGASLHIGYFAQAHEGLDPQKTLMQEIQSVRPEFLLHEVRDLLGKFLFSGGERGRLALAKLALQQTNFLLLDEPTNHLDIPAQEVLQSVLDNYEGTILLVSHDRYLIDALATQIWEIDPDESALTVYNGTYSQMKEEREKQAARLAEQQQESSVKATLNAKRSTSNARTKEERRKVAQLQEIENAIAALEADLANLGAQLESPLVHPKEVAKLGKEYERVQREMDEKLKEWERVQV
jgi:ATP-binding cassette subfamily F protein 3